MKRKASGVGAVSSSRWLCSPVWNEALLPTTFWRFAITTWFQCKFYYAYHSRASRLQLLHAPQRKLKNTVSFSSCSCLTRAGSPPSAWLSRRACFWAQRVSRGSVWGWRFPKKGTRSWWSADEPDDSRHDRNREPAQDGRRCWNVQSNRMRLPNTQLDFTQQPYIAMALL